MAKANSRWSARWPMIFGFVTFIALCAGVYVWGIKAQIAGAIVAAGRVAVETNQQIVQHPDGGVVGDILARDGDQVSAGDTVLRLDGTFLRSELAIIESQLFDIWARRARLTAERDGAAQMVLPPELDGPHGRDLFAGQARLFDARRASTAAQIRQIEQQAGQLGDQITGVQAELTALERQTQLLNAELSSSETLLDKGLIQTRQVLALQRQQAQLEGAMGRQSASIAQLRGQITALETEKLRLAARRREEAITALRDLNFRAAELAERRLSLTERLNRLDIRAPVDGVVFGSTVFARQAVIPAAAPVMYIIPSDQPMIVDARIDTIHIDQMQIGQRASLRFAAFDQRRTPEVFGKVTHLSASALTDEITGQGYYQVLVQPDAADMSKLNGQVLVPGMPVDAFIQTGERSPLNYLVKPLTDYFAKAFRED